jgi:hypothetical protein
MDAELSSFFPPVPLVTSRITRVASPVPAAIALGCGDPDGDGSLELVVVGRHTIHTGRIVKGRFQPLSSRAWAELSPIAPSPLQQPITTLSIKTGAGMVVGTTDRARSLTLDGRLSLLTHDETQLPWPALGCVQREGLGLQATIRACTSGAVLYHPTTQGPLDAVAGAVLTRGKQARHLYATRQLGTSIVEVEDDAGQRIQLQHAGAQIAIGDLNRDGAPEIITSSDTLLRKDDRVRVHSWGSGAVTPSIELEVKTGVDAIAICPSQGGGLSPFAVATGAQLWVVE